MGVADELLNIAEQLLDLSRIPDLRIESSPAAMKRLCDTHNRLAQISDRIEASVEDSRTPGEAALHRAQLADVALSLNDLLAAVETSAQSSYDPIRAITQLALELRAISQNIAMINGDHIGGPDRSVVTDAYRDNLLPDQVAPKASGSVLPLKMKTSTHLDKESARKPDQESGDGEHKTLRFTDVKRSSLEKQKASLVSQYEAAAEQLSNTLNAADRVPLKNQLSQLEQKILEIEDELIRLK